MAMTLDQERARFAWDKAFSHREVDGYREMAKSAPALIMGSGLMPTLAYWHSRTGSNARPAMALCDDVLEWMSKRKFTPHDFRLGMESLLNVRDPLLSMQVMDDVLAMLKWLRQFSDAVADDRS